jgi:hypothetical protein
MRAGPVFLNLLQVGIPVMRNNDRNGNDHHIRNKSHIKKHALTLDHTHSTALSPKHEATIEPGLTKMTLTDS